MFILILLKHTGSSIYSKIFGNFKLVEVVRARETFHTFRQCFCFFFPKAIRNKANPLLCTTTGVIIIIIIL